MDELIAALQVKFPHLNFAAGRQFSWSPETSQIFYKKNARGRKALWSLLHETGHAALDHRSYQGDFELLQMELAAWEKARQLGQDVGVEISEDHIQDCLETYREWLYKRSICPNCGTKSLQADDYSHYNCHNCHSVWRVSASRFHRPYRRSNGPTIEKSLL
jgi:ribosomal protein S27AE